MNQRRNLRSEPTEDQGYLTKEDRRILVKLIRFVIGLTLSVNIIVFGLIFLVNH